MTKEKFERSNYRVNIENIKPVNYDENKAEKVSELLHKNYEKHTQKILQNLINRYGEEEGKKQFENLVQQSSKRFEDYKNIDSMPEKTEDSIHILRKR